MEHRSSQSQLFERRLTFIKQPLWIIRFLVEYLDRSCDELRSLRTGIVNIGVENPDLMNRHELITLSTAACSMYKLTSMPGLTSSACTTTFRAAEDSIKLSSRAVMKISGLKVCHSASGDGFTETADLKTLQPSTEGSWAPRRAWHVEQWRSGLQN